jgi:ribokinase
VIAVVGSVNLDIVVEVERHPAPGETVAGGDAAELHGGKGANQAVAAARAGSEVSFVGRVGDDAAGRMLREGLIAEGVNVAHLRTDIAAPSGRALIAVDPHGENTIVVSPGANARVGAADVDDASDVLRDAAVTLVQHEIPAAAVVAAAREAGGTFVCNPAPARELVAGIDVLVPNERELAALGGDPEALGIDAVVVTLGARGALVVAGGRREEIPAPSVDAVDTTGAGDVFCGVLAHALAGGAELVEAARDAVTAASESVARKGARG